MTYNAGMGRPLVRLTVRAAELTPSGVLQGSHLEIIRNLLRQIGGGFAIIPSDTCYSLAAIPFDVTMSQRINQILHRKKEPISLAFDGIQRAREWVNLNTLEVRLLEHLTPGPLTVVCTLSGDVNRRITDDVLTAPRRTLGVRIPDSRIEAQIVGALHSPVTTVAVRDLSTKKPVTDFEQAREIVLAGLELIEDPPQIALVEARQAFQVNHSTVVRVSGSSPRGFDLLRPGAISEDQIQQALSQISQWELAQLEEERGEG